jgi:hypothetical protein
MELGPLPEGYTTTEPAINYDKIRAELENEIKEYRKQLSYGGVYINNVRFGTDATDVAWIEGALSWYPKHWNDNLITSSIQTLTVNLSGRGYVDSTLDSGITPGSILVLGPPSEFVIDTPSTETTSGTGHFNISIENYYTANQSIVVGDQILTITNISSSEGTDIGSVEFTNGISLTAGTHVVYPDAMHPTYLIKISQILNDGTTAGDIGLIGITDKDMILPSITTTIDIPNSDSLTYITTKSYKAQDGEQLSEVNVVDTVNIFGINYVREIYAEPYLNWQITTDGEVGFYMISITESILKIVYDIISDFGETCFDVQSAKREALYNTPDEELVNFDITTGWPNREFII